MFVGNGKLRTPIFWPIHEAAIPQAVGASNNSSTSAGNLPSEGPYKGAIPAPKCARSYGFEGYYSVAPSWEKFVSGRLPAADWISVRIRSNANGSCCRW